MPRRAVAKCKKYSEMTTQELAAATKEFDKELAFLEARPLTDREKKLHVNARKCGRPRIVMGAEKIQVSVKRGLPIRSDAFAKKHRMSRSDMVARGLKAVLAASGAE